MAAQRHGLGTILIPKDNVRDLEEIDQKIKAFLRFVPVETVDQVFAEALCPAAPVIREERPETLSVFSGCESSTGDTLRQ